jgi:uncharacterized membrane protein YqjE
MNQETPGEAKGLFESLKGLAASLAAIAHTRLDLLSSDLEEDREQLVSMLVMTLVALFCLGVGMVLLAILVVVAFWDSYRLLVLGGLTGIFLAGGAATWWFALCKLRTKPRLFAASMAELSKDRQQLIHRS